MKHYESYFYYLKDKGGPLNGAFVIQSSAVFASINVIDVSDLDPQFINLPYVATVDENTPVVSVNDELFGSLYMGRCFLCVHL